MNLDELQSVQSKERRNDTLQHLRDSFYDDVGEYVADLKNRRDLAADRADDPFGSPEVRRLTDEIETAEEVVEKVYERRMGKLVKQASLAAAGMNADTEGMTVEERDLFDDIVESIQGNKADVLATLSGEAAAPDTDPEPDPSPTERSHAATESELSAASMMADDGPAKTADDAPADRSADPLSDPDDDADRPPTEAHAVVGDDEEMTDGGATLGVTGDDAVGGGPSGAADAGIAGDAGGAVETDRSTVRITDDVGPIFGVDGREYDLERSDVVQLPEQNAEPLLEQDAAERLD